MKLYIPEIGDSIKLIADWTFDLFNEDRNGTLMERLKDPRRTIASWHADYGSLPATIPAGAVLKIDRVYIRKGSKDFSSVTFLWKGERLPAHIETYSDGYTAKIPAIPVRFWAKLVDVNNIEFEKVE
jgi:hypothetical protein